MCASHRSSPTPTATPPSPGATRATQRALAVNSPVTVPDGIVPDDQGIIMTEVSFTYTSLFGMFLTDGMTVSDTFYLKPRRSTQVLRE